MCPASFKSNRLSWCRRASFYVFRRTYRSEHNVEDAKQAVSKVADAIAEEGLSRWLDAVRRHHEDTYQHCLLVTGIAVDFGLSLGLAKPDIERLYSAAMFHDIGKAKIPLAVLDKPGRLDAAERALIETHPVAGFDLLKGTCGISAEILDAVRHHHEYLDGSGYPDALCGDNIADIVRVLTISDVFAALIEDSLNNLSERIRESASCRQENCAKSNENLLFDREQNEPQPRIWQNEPNEILQQNPRV